MRYLGHSYLLHNQQLERVKTHAVIPKKKKSQSLYIDFLIARNTALENMCRAYCSVFSFKNGINIVVYGVTSTRFSDTTYEG
jgi:hypothetical protein